MSRLGRPWVVYFVNGDEVTVQAINAAHAVASAVAKQLQRLGTEGVNFSAISSKFATPKLGCERVSIKRTVFYFGEEKAQDRYGAAHKLCPACRASDIERTCVGQIPMAGLEIKDHNRATCKCGWVGIVDELTPA